MIISDVVIGFELTGVIGEESVGVVTLVVSVLDGGTTTPITVDFTTQNGTAMSMLYIAIILLLYFSLYYLFPNDIRSLGFHQHRTAAILQ